MPACSSIYRLRAFFACFPAPCGFLFLSFPSGSACFSSPPVPLWCRFYRFPVSVPYCFLVVFSPFGRRFPPFHLFPVRFPHCRGVPWGCALLLSACSRLVSRLGIRVVGRGGVACSVGWGIVPWRGVEGMAGCLAAFCLTARFYGMRGGEFWVVFSCGNYRRVVRGARRICCVGW